MAPPTGSPTSHQEALQMAEIESPYCPECDDAFNFPEPPPVDRRNFFRAVGVGAAAVAATSLVGRAADTAPAAARKAAPAEDLIRELYNGLKDNQKKKVALPYDHRMKGARRPTRLGMYNAPINNIRIEDVYTKPQTELIDRIVKAMSSGDNGYRQISRL